MANQMYSFPLLKFYVGSYFLSSAKTDFLIQIRVLCLYVQEESIQNCKRIQYKNYDSVH